MDLAQPYLLQRIVDVGIDQLNVAVILNTGLLMDDAPCHCDLFRSGKAASSVTGRS